MGDHGEFFVRDQCILEEYDVEMPESRFNPKWDLKLNGIVTVEVKAEVPHAKGNAFTVRADSNWLKCVTVDRLVVLSVPGPWEHYTHGYAWVYDRIAKGKDIAYHEDYVRGTGLDMIFFKTFQFERWFKLNDYQIELLVKNSQARKTKKERYYDARV